MLLIDDFPANGSAPGGLCVEKAFQSGGVRVRGKGVRVEAPGPDRRNERKRRHVLLRAA